MVISVNTGNCGRHLDYHKSCHRHCQVNLSLQSLYAEISIGILLFLALKRTRQKKCGTYWLFKEVLKKGKLRFTLRQSFHPSIAEASIILQNTMGADVLDPYVTKAWVAMVMTLFWREYFVLSIRHTHQDYRIHFTTGNENHSINKRNCISISRDHFVNAPNQWEKLL